MLPQILAEEQLADKRQIQCNQGQKAASGFPQLSFNARAFTTHLGLFTQIQLFGM
jgi:hypothetical protein